MSIILCLTGAHGAGKSTLAQAISKGCGLTLYPSRASEIHRAHGVTASDHVSFEKRIDIQVDILSAWLNDYAHAQESGHGIFDRSPADMLAYLLADLHRKSDAKPAMIEHYREACVLAIGQIDHLLLVDPLQHSIEDRGADKPDAHNVGFMWHHHYLVAGIAAQTSPGHLRLFDAPLEHRLASVTHYLEAVFAQKARDQVEGRYDNDLEESSFH